MFSKCTHFSLVEAQRDPERLSTRPPFLSKLGRKLSTGYTWVYLAVPLGVPRGTVGCISLDAGRISRYGWVYLARRWGYLALRLGVPRVTLGVSRGTVGCTSRDAGGISRYGWVCLA
jgi:hypothetical protein